MLLFGQFDVSHHYSAYANLCAPYQCGPGSMAERHARCVLPVHVDIRANAALAHPCASRHKTIRGQNSLYCAPL